jgi:adenine-specific DNA-methyltransferase
MGSRSPKTKKPTPVDATKHRKASRTNIPTAELEGFADDAEKRPAVVRYRRDPSLDPQLVWRGKDEQDAIDLAVPAVPIYIQEKIAPQAIIEDLRVSSRRTERDSQAALFGDFNGLPFEQMVDFYHWPMKWTNRMILGDSLLVMTSLAEKEGLRGKVQMIYVDPPYGIKFGSNWQVSTRKRDVRDGRAEDATRQPEQIRAFRDTWELGIHSYLSYLRDRLASARELLSETGSVFVQIGDENMHLVRSVLDEVFGSNAYVAVINYTKTSSQTARYLPVTTDYVLWYARDFEQMKFRPLYVLKSLGGSRSDMYQHVELPDRSRRRLTRDEIENPDSLPEGARPYRLGDITSQRQGRPSGPGTAMYFPVRVDGQDFLPPGARGWSTTAAGMERLKLAARLQPQGERLSYMRYLDDFGAAEVGNDWSDTAGATDRVYVVQTNPTVVARSLLLTTDPGDLVLDPTCGSGTTAYVAEQWGRRWITIDTSRVALALARTRLMTGRYPFYLLADSEAGVRKESELIGKVPPSPLPPTESDVRKGFVYERVPHVTLKSIANNPEVREGMTREEIDVAIAKHADTETLFDRPYVDGKVVRVTGPFTVESLSPHRVLPDGGETPTVPDDGRFITHILDNLRKAGVQNTVKNERLVFERLDLWPGEYVQASGEYREKDATRTVAVAIGPEYGTVGSDFVREAAKEAVKFADLLVIAGFAFDALATETAKLGRLTILKAKINPDLAIGDELLKKTGAGNLFMVFGEPDVAIQKTPDGLLMIEIRGVDVYDPTTGALRSHSTDEIACWFVDTEYNEQSFFVRHAYFSGADDPYDKLKRVLKADIDQDAWASLYQTKSRPFPRPETGKIAVKVINHYGDEVLKVYAV